MRRSNNYNKRETTAFLYVRLSRDDGFDGDSYSVSNQKQLLTKIAKEKGYTNIIIFCDDGISGVTMNRPGFNEMIQQIEQGKGSAVFVKDLSRLGRNYIEVGRLIEEFFPEHDIRLVSVSDNLDTKEGDDELAPIKNLFNEWYSRDISKKRRISNKIKGNSGIPLGPPPYGYIKDPNDQYHWIKDPEACFVVKRAFMLVMEGYGVWQIADKFAEEKILTPSEYAFSKGINRPNRKSNDNPYFWSASTVSAILTKQEYCGDIINFKTYSKSYKNKKRLKNDQENMMVFYNVNEAIVERELFEKVQRIKERGRRKTTTAGDKNMFSGLLVCSDCGKILHYHFNQANPEIKYFNCPGYNSGKRKECFSTHYIRVDFLEQVVLGEIRRLTRFAIHYENEFTKAVADYSKNFLNSQQEVRKRELNSLKSRDKELDGLFEKLYEDNVSGKISDERFAKMSANYEIEQSDIAEKVKKINKEMNEAKDKLMSTDSFVGIVKKYTRVKKLTPRMLNELIDHIEVFHTEKIDGVNVQRLRIYYNFIGSVDIPEELTIPETKVSVETRKGVVVNFQSA